MPEITALQGSRLVVLGAVKAALMVGRYVLVPLGQVISAGFGVGLMLVGSELMYYNPAGPLNILRHQNLVTQGKFRPIGRALIIVGGVLVYGMLDFFFLRHLVGVYDDYFRRTVAEIMLDKLD